HGDRLGARAVGRAVRSHFRRRRPAPRVRRRPRDAGCSRDGDRFRYQPMIAKRHLRMNRRTAGYVAMTMLAAACTPQNRDDGPDRGPLRIDGTVVAVKDTALDAVLDAAGV